MKKIHAFLSSFLLPALSWGKEEVTLKAGSAGNFFAGQYFGFELD